MTISKDILQEIKKNKIEPKSKLTFLVKNSLVWIIGVLFMVVSGLSASVFMQVIKNNNWGMHRNISSFSNYALVILPAFWIVLLIIFIFLIYFNLKHTKKGYKYPVLVVIVLSVVASIVLGTLFYSVGTGKRIDNVFSNRISAYNRVFCQQTVVWHKPTVGMVVGEVIKVTPGRCYILDINNVEWEIEVDSLDLSVIHAIDEGKMIKVIGEITGDNIIRANRLNIMPCSCHSIREERVDFHNLRKNQNRIDY